MSSTNIFDIEIPDWFKPGASFRYDFGPSNHHTGRKFHIRAVVDDLFVIREWSKGRQSWNYEVQGKEYYWAYRQHIVQAN